MRPKLSTSGVESLTAVSTSVFLQSRLKCESMQMEISNLIADTSRNLSSLETRMKELEDEELRRRRLRKISAASIVGTDDEMDGRFHYQSFRESESICHVFANRVNTIVGLEEVIKSEHKAIKAIWILLVVLGVVGTFYCLVETAKEFFDNPTATYVELHRKPEHPFPPMLLCPTAWFDAEKAHAVNLSTDALSYSLSYPMDQYSIPVANISAARSEFYAFYNQHQFESLLDYYKWIANDLKSSINASLSPLTYGCTGCDDGRQQPERMLLDDRMCYAFYFRPMSENSALLAMSGNSANSRSVTIKHQARTRGLVQDSEFWSVYFPTFEDSFISMYPKVTVRSWFHNTLRFDQQRFIFLNNPDAPCHESRVSSGDDGHPYSAVRCMSQCHNRMYAEARNCSLLWLSAPSANLHPWQVCNFLDRLSGTTLMEFFDSPTNKRIDRIAAEQCVARCPIECDRVILETTLQHQDAYLDDERGEQAINHVSMIDLTVEHGAVYQGGVSTLEERSQYSPTQLVNNIGGTLGLFVGATLMTLAQAILSFIDYLATRLGCSSEQRS